MSAGPRPALDELRALLAAIPDEIGDKACEGWFEWQGGDRQPDGSITMPQCLYGPRFDAFWGALRRAGALDDTDYMRWPGLAEYESGQKRITDAPRSDLGKWLFAVYRQDRFIEGLWSGQLRRGRLKEAVARLIALGGEGE